MLSPVSALASFAAAIHDVDSWPKLAAYALMLIAYVVIAWRHR